MTAEKTTLPFKSSFGNSFLEWNAFWDEIRGFLIEFLNYWKEKMLIGAYVRHGNSKGIRHHAENTDYKSLAARSETHAATRPEKTKINDLIKDYL